MIPMCYPSDAYDAFIPNWGMWYILELEKYANRWGRDEIIEQSKAKVDGLLQYFASKENEFGVLENLDGWVFVEWSSANDASHIQGVNIPSNICYAATLKAAANLYAYEKLLKKADRIYTHIEMPLTAIADFAELGKADNRFAVLAQIVERNNGLWCAEAEQYLLQNW